MRHSQDPFSQIPGWQPEYSTNADRPSMLRRAAAVGMAVLAAAGATVGIALSQSGESSPTQTPPPHELEVAGSIDMEQVSQQIASHPDVARTKAADEPIVLSEYDFNSRAVGSDKFKGISNAWTPPDLQEKLDKVVKANSLTLRYLDYADLVDTVRFTVSPKPRESDDNTDGDMRYHPPTDDEYGSVEPGYIEYELPATGEVSLDTMATMLEHEGHHPLQHSLDIIGQSKDVSKSRGAGGTYTDKSAYVEDVTIIRNAAIDAAEHDHHVQEAAKQVIAASESVGTPYAAAEAKVAQAVLDGAFNELQPTAEHRSAIEDLAESKSAIPEGRTNPPSFVVAYDSGLSDEDKAQPKTPALVAAEAQFDEAFLDAMYTSPESPYAVFKESNHLEHADKLTGHPHGSLDELLVGATNSMMAAPEQLAEGLRKLPEAARAASVDLLERTVSDTRRGFIGGVPAIKLGDAMQENLDWVEEATSN